MMRVDSVHENVRRILTPLAMVGYALSFVAEQKHRSCKTLEQNSVLIEQVLV